MLDSVRPHRWQPTRLPCPWDSPGKNTGVGCHFLLQCMTVKREGKVAQSCRLFATPWTAAYQAPPSMGFSRQEYSSGLPLPSPKVIKTCCCSVPQPCLILCDPTDCSMPGVPVPHHLPEFAQIRVHCIDDAIQPSHPLTSCSSPAFHLSPH